MIEDCKLKSKFSTLTQEVCKVVEKNIDVIDEIKHKNIANQKGKGEEILPNDF